MMRSNSLRLILALALVLGLPVPQAGADQIVIGSGNSINELHSGSYGELFPGGTAAQPGNMVLALDVVSPDGSRDRWLVPSTESSDLESSQMLVYERESDRLYVFWETVIHGIHPALYLTSFDGSGWGQQIEFIGSPFARKKSLELVISRDSEARLMDGESEGLTVLHVFWAEERPGTSEKRYAPILLINGEYSGSTPVYDLDSLAAVGDAEAAPVSPGIADGIQAQAGSDSHSCVVGFLDPATHRLRTLEIDLLPPTLTGFAGKIRAEIIGLGQKVETHEVLAAAVSERLAELGDGFHDSVLEYMIERIDQVITMEETQPLNATTIGLLADKIRAEIIGLGSRIGAGGLVESDDFELVELSLPGAGTGLEHLLKVTPVSSREAPVVDGEATMWLSESGRHVLVTWEDERRIYYRESLEGETGWSEIASIELDNGLDREEIYRTLAERVRSR